MLRHPISGYLCPCPPGVPVEPQTAVTNRCLSPWGHVLSCDNAASEDNRRADIGLLKRVSQVRILPGAPCKTAVQNCLRRPESQPWNPSHDPPVSPWCPRRSPEPCPQWPHSPSRWPRDRRRPCPSRVATNAGGAGLLTSATSFARLTRETQGFKTQADRLDTILRRLERNSLARIAKAAHLLDLDGTFIPFSPLRGAVACLAR